MTSCCFDLELDHGLKSIFCWGGGAIIIYSIAPSIFSTFNDVILLFTFMYIYIRYLKGNGHFFFRSTIVTLYYWNYSKATDIVRA